VPDWTVVIPVKGTASAKSRLGASPELALAIALDTVAAAVDAARVLVVTSSALASSAIAPRVIATQFEALGALVIADNDAGLAAAIAQGVAQAGDDFVAVLLGDLPALRSSELRSALELAEQHPLAFVPDADNDGTVLIAAHRATDHRPAFGVHSRAGHLAAGYLELNIPLDSGLRRDVDTGSQLAALGPRVGARTRALLP
jgi:2-phospho-L-lactate guanylyltransferase